MKNLLLLFAMAFTLSCCNNDDDNSPTNAIDQLPPATQTGAQTIGCLVNGVPFTDSGLMNNFYQFIEGEYFLGINMNYNQGLSSKNLRIQFRRVEIVENQIYFLNMNDLDDGDFTGGKGQYTFTENYLEDGFQYDTNNEFSGEIHFTKFDIENNIMSGTFEFEAQEITTGEIITITDGRFDLNFTN